MRGGVRFSCTINLHPMSIPRVNKFITSADKLDLD